MRNLLIRSASAIIYGALLIIGCVFYTPVLYATLGLFAVFGIIELKNLSNIKISKNALTIWIALCLIDILSFILLIEANLLDINSLLLLISAICLQIFVISFFSNLVTNKILQFLSTSAIYIVFPLIWINDTFAYIIGSLVGKHKFCEKISPKKTWEGLLGGFIITLVAAIIINLYYFKFENTIVLTSVLIVCVSATLGDLFESKIKREAEVKDSGKLIPGHGGILDRIDSLLIAAPTFSFFILILKYF
jgi:phosphatidate cytidylyltransferase